MADDSLTKADNASTANARASASDKAGQPDGHTTPASDATQLSSNRMHTNKTDNGNNGDDKGSQPNNTPEEIRKTVAGGLEALGKIAELLRTPESTKALVDSIVTENPETGETSLNIPVPVKSTVVNILSAFSAFLNR